MGIISGNKAGERSEKYKLVGVECFNPYKSFLLPRRQQETVPFIIIKEADEAQ